MTEPVYDNSDIAKYQPRIDKGDIPICTILGVNIAAIDMDWLLKYLKKNVRSKDGNRLAGDYICVANVHTTVTAYDNHDYRSIQNGGLMAIPDGGPLSSIGKKRGYSSINRITGPSFMEEVFKISSQYGFRHFFYGSTPETIQRLNKVLENNYPQLQIAGLYSPAFKPLTEEEDRQIIMSMNDTHPDFIWVGLGAPKQERWMAAHQGIVNGLMIGVGAGFDYYAGNISRAPEWMQKNNLEWVYRLIQDPKRLFARYLITNTKFIWHAVLGRK